MPSLPQRYPVVNPNPGSVLWSWLKLQDYVGMMCEQKKTQQKDFEGRQKRDFHHLGLNCCQHSQPMAKLTVYSTVEGVEESLAGYNYREQVISISIDLI